MAYATETVNGQPNPLSHGPIVAIPHARAGRRLRCEAEPSGADRRWVAALPAVTFRQPGELPMSPAGLPTAKDVDDALAAPTITDFEPEGRAGRRGVAGEPPPETFRLTYQPLARYSKRMRIVPGEEGRSR